MILNIRARTALNYNLQITFSTARSMISRSMISRSMISEKKNKAVIACYNYYLIIGQLALTKRITFCTHIEMQNKKTKLCLNLPEHITK